MTDQRNQKGNCRSEGLAILALALPLLLLAFVACGGMNTAPASPDSDGDGQAAANPEDLDLALTPGMEIGVGSTGLVGLVRPSEVDPTVPGGGMLVTVEDISPGEELKIGWWHTEEQDREPASPTPVTGVGTPTPSPVVETVRVEGTITSTGLSDAHEALLPMFWEPGDKTTGSSLMWLSRASFEELKTKRRTRWSRDIITTLSRLPETALRQVREETAEREVWLKAEPDFMEFEVTVDGQTVMLPAIQAYDDFGNEYIVLADEDNPLIVRFTFNAVSTGTVGLDAGVWALIKATYSGYEVVEIGPP